MIKVLLQCDECDNLSTVPQIGPQESLDIIALQTVLYQGWRRVERHPGTLRAKDVLLCPDCVRKEPI